MVRAKYEAEFDRVASSTKPPKQLGNDSQRNAEPATQDVDMQETDAANGEERKKRKHKHSKKQHDSSTAEAAEDEKLETVEEADGDAKRKKKKKKKAKHLNTTV